MASKEALEMFNDKSKRAMAKFKAYMHMYMTRYAYMRGEVLCVVESSLLHLRGQIGGDSSQARV